MGVESGGVTGRLIGGVAVASGASSGGVESGGTTGDSVGEVAMASGGVVLASGASQRATVASGDTTVKSVGAVAVAWDDSSGEAFVSGCATNESVGDTTTAAAGSFAGAVMTEGSFRDAGGFGFDLLLLRVTRELLESLECFTMVGSVTTVGCGIIDAGQTKEHGLRVVQKEGMQLHVASRRGSSASSTEPTDTVLRAHEAVQKRLHAILVFSDQVVSANARSFMSSICVGRG